MSTFKENLKITSEKRIELKTVDATIEKYTRVSRAKSSDGGSLDRIAPSRTKRFSELQDIRWNDQCFQRETLNSDEHQLSRVRC